VDSTKKTARLAGLLYFLSALTAPFGLLYVPGKIFVPDNAAATAENIRTFESLMRWGIAANLVGGVVFIFALLALYRLFKPVSEKHALAMLVLLLLSFPISFVNVLNELAALNLAKGGALSALEASQRDALAYLFMWLHGRAFVVAQILWGLWLFPFGICVMRSGFIPRFLGVLLMIAGAGYPISSFAELVLPQYADAVARATMILAFGELPIIFWLLIWGAKPQRQPLRPAAAP
jgi:Domain of unknown function (DUF4386)